MHSKNFLTFKQNIWQTLQDIGVGKNYNIGVLTRTPNTKTNPKNQHMKLKSHCTAKQTVVRLKRHPYNEKENRCQPYIRQAINMEDI